MSKSSSSVVESSEALDHNAEGNRSDAGSALGEGRSDLFANSFLWFSALPSWLTSTIVHVIVLLLLALFTIENPFKDKKTELTIGNAEDVALEDPSVFELQEELVLENITDGEDFEITQPSLESFADEVVASQASEMDAVAMTTDFAEIGFESMLQGQPSSQDSGGVTGEGLDGRSQAMRAQLLKKAGGTAGSERAVEMALDWFQRHQNPDGSWCFTHLYGNCPCPNHGNVNKSNNGATAMALLPFLGAGHTHMEGKYKQEVYRGLYYLLAHQKANGSFHEPGGNMYSHGLCAIALSEAYAMTQDADLMRPAQAALDFIAYAQDPVGGGWRYEVKQPGDTSVVGWQLMALKSGRMAYLNVHPVVFARANKFLDSVQTNNGSAYGYSDPGNRYATSSIGLLCRMYMGWEHDHPALVEGVQRIGKKGPDKEDMYYNYYATQVMRHYEGDEWAKWNAKMRDYLVETQEQRGHMSGSWFMKQGHQTDKGGRLYCTAMATMILEVYYRHLPIYRNDATEDDFEL